VAEVAVVGAGLAGMAAAALLAKLGHAVTVFEQEAVAGGRLRGVERDGFGWTSGVSTTGLPAALRDLFRTSGRPIERYLDLRSLPARRHVFPDGAWVDLPTGSRAEQMRAVDAGLGPGQGRRWTQFVDGQADVWDRFRRSPAGPDWDGSATTGSGHGRLPVRRTLRQVTASALPDERLQHMVTYPYVLAGSDPREVPGVAAAGAYVERSFGLWRCASGLAEVADALVTRLTERGVEVRYDARVARIEVVGDRVSGVVSADGSRKAVDIVVAAIDPLVVFADLLGAAHPKALRLFRAGRRVEPPAVTFLGLRDSDADSRGSDRDIVLHGDPLVEVCTAGAAPDGHRAMTVRYRGDSAGDVITVMARRGLDVRRDVVTRVDLSPGQARSTAGGGYGLAWDGWKAYQRRAACLEPYAGVHVVAAALTPAATVPQVVWTAAHVANRIGKA
jgi:phytoene dehydrogenase-like protein